MLFLSLGGSDTDCFLEAPFSLLPLFLAQQQQQRFAVLLPSVTASILPAPPLYSELTHAHTGLQLPTSGESALLFGVMLALKREHCHLPKLKKKLLF